MSACSETDMQRYNAFILSGEHNFQRTKNFLSSYFNEMRVSSLLQNGCLCSSNSIHFKRWRVYTQLRLPGCACFIYMRRLKQIVQHFYCILECVYSLPMVTTVSPFHFSRFPTNIDFFAPLEFFFLCFLCCNQT